MVKKAVNVSYYIPACCIHFPRPANESCSQRIRSWNLCLVILYNVEHPDLTCIQGDVYGSLSGASLWKLMPMCCPLSKDASSVIFSTGMDWLVYIFFKFIYFWLCLVLVAARASSSCGLQPSHCGGFSYCGPQALGPESFSCCSAWSRKLWCTGLVTPWHVASSQTRDQTPVPCIGRWLLYHWMTREVLASVF